MELAESGDLEGAAENLGRSFELDPFDAETASNLSAVLAGLGRWAELVRGIARPAIR